MTDHGIEHLAVYAAHLVRVVERWGISPERLLEGLPIAVSDLDDRDRRVPDRAMKALIHRSIELTREPGLGFHLGMQVKISAHGAVGLAAMTAATMRDALTIGETYFALRGGDVHYVHYVDGDRAVIEVLEHAPLVEPFAIEALFTGLSQLAQVLLGQPLRGLIEVRYREPKHFRGFAHLWPGPARFERGVNRISFPASLLDARLVLADDFASRDAIARCEAELASLGETSSFLASVRTQIRNRNRGYLSLTELADVRRTSVRTLKRKFAEHGTSFQIVLDELRRDRAIELLEQPRFTVDRIASDLGYADTANFRRAFRKWTGMAPGEWRERNVLDEKR